ncbi:MAG TPA: hypothetical protein VHS54_11590 [Jatrophihabitans sp.]|nr:hypothetical protein [Jatrophihabitans sp.]
MAAVDRLGPADDDVLELGPARGRGRVGLVLVAAVVTVAAGILVRHGEGHRAPQPVTSAAPVAAAVPHTAVLIDGRSVVVLVHGRLRVQERASGRLLGQTRAPDPGTAGTVELVTDPDTGLLWAVTANSVPTRIAAYRLPSLRLVRQVSWVRLVVSAAAVAGHLYVSTSVGVADLAPGAATPEPVPGLYGAVGPLVVDRSRHRIIAADLGYPTDVWSYRPGAVPQASSAPLRIADATLAVVGNRIWIAGHQGERAVLWRLDPATLAVVDRARPVSGPRARLALVAAGADVIWLRGSNDADRLFCADADRGALLQAWRVRGSVDSTSGLAYADTADGLRALALAGCPG